MTSLFRHILPLLLLAVACALSARAESGAESRAAADPAGDLEVVEDELETSTEAQATIVRGMAAAIHAQEEASSKLVDLARTARAQEEALALTAKKLARLKRDNAKALLALANKRDAMSKLLAGLQRLEQNPPPALVVDPDDVLQALRGAMMFGAVIPELRRETGELREALTDVEAIKQALEDEKTRHATALVALDETRATVARVVEERQKAAAVLAGELAAARQEHETLATRAKSLKELVADLAKAKAAEAERLQAEAQAEVRANAEAAAKAEAQALVLAEAERKKAAAKPTIAFSESRGRLEFPVIGEVWKPFGVDNGLDGHTTGVFLSSQVRAQVLSPVDGTIEFAGKFRSYDQVVIINPGEGYLVLLAGMKEITAGSGQSVRAGEPVGIMGDTPAPLQLVTDLADVKTPVLYVEFRKKNEPVDPTPWWNNRRKEAMR